MPPAWKKFCKLAQMVSKMEDLGEKKIEWGVFAMMNSSSMPIVIIEEVLLV